MDENKGVIIKLNEKGYGFIRPVEYVAHFDRSHDIFFHSSSLVDIDFGNLERGLKVYYSEKPGPKGKVAVDVTIDYLAYIDKNN